MFVCLFQSATPDAVLFSPQPNVSRLALLSIGSETKFSLVTNVLEKLLFWRRQKAPKTETRKVLEILALCNQRIKKKAA